MKVIKFENIKENPSDAITYPDESNLFGHTIVEGGFIVGEYFGELPLDEYLGVWPIPTPQQYQTVFKSNNPTIKRIGRRFELRNKNMDVANAQYIEMIAAFVTDAIVDQARADELLLGIPE